MEAYYDKLEIFIHENRDLLDSNNFEELYELALQKFTFNSDNYIPILTQILYKSGINPLNYLKAIPEYFLAHADILSSSELEYIIKNIPKNITAAKQAAFYGTTLKNIDLSNSAIQTFNNYCMFAQCHELETVKLPDTMIYLCEEAFFGCNLLRELDLGNSLENLPRSFIVKCDSLKELKIPNSVRYIHPDAFTACKVDLRLIYDGTKEEWEIISENVHFQSRMTVEFLG